MKVTDVLDDLDNLDSIIPEQPKETPPVRRPSQLAKQAKPQNDYVQFDEFLSPPQNKAKLATLTKSDDEGDPANDSFELSDKKDSVGAFDIKKPPELRDVAFNDIKVGKSTIEDLLDSPSMADIKKGIFADDKPKPSKYQFLPSLDKPQQVEDFDFDTIQDLVDQETTLMEKRDSLANSNSSDSDRGQVKLSLISRNRASNFKVEISSKQSKNEGSRLSNHKTTPISGGEPLNSFSDRMEKENRRTPSKGDGDPLSDSLNEVQESQMFKELFQKSNLLSNSGKKARANRGLAPQPEPAAQSPAEVQGLVNGLKLVSELKNQELQHRAQDTFMAGGPLGGGPISGGPIGGGPISSGLIGGGPLLGGGPLGEALSNPNGPSDKSLNKNRSKKDLKNNKFQSSAVAYMFKGQNIDGIEEDLPEGEKENNKWAKKAGKKLDVDDIINQYSLEEEQKSGRVSLGSSSNDAKEINPGKVKDDESGSSTPKAQEDVDELIKQHLLEEEDPEQEDQLVKSNLNDVDEIIKQHLMEEETQPKKKVVIKSKQKKAKKKNADLSNLSPQDATRGDEKTQAACQDAKVGDDSDSLERSSSDEDEIEEDIMKEPDEPMVSIQHKIKKSIGTNKDDDEDSDPYEYMEESINVKTPKQTLIEHLRLLADIFNSSLDGASDYYDQIFDERAQFMLDFDNILKIMTFDETVEYVLPCMQIYSSEQDYLKLKLFQNLEKLFKKLFKAEDFIPKAEIIDIITINIFPLASRMLMLSEEPVQMEGVDSLLNLCKQYIPKEQSQNLMQKVIQVIMDRISSSSEHQETEEVREKAKIAVLIIMQKFTDEGIFEKEQCDHFLDTYLEHIENGMLFKIKKFLMPALISVAKYLDYQSFVDKVYGSFTTFSKDDIWGVRKVCVENLSKLITLIRKDEVDKFNECSEFFKKALNDSNRWVKNQALIQYGPVVHELFKKLEVQERAPSPDNQAEKSTSSSGGLHPEQEEGSKKALPTESETDKQLKELINDLTLFYYDTKTLVGEKDETDLEGSLMEKLEEYSFMQNKADDADKVKYYWAYNMPCALLVNGGQAFWLSHMKAVYQLLYKDSQANVRTALSAGFKEIVDLLDLQKMEKQEERQFFVDVMNHYLQDSEDIVQKVIPHICHLVSKFPDEQKTELLDTLIRSQIEEIKNLKNGRDSLISILEQLFQMFQPTQLLEANFQDYLFEILKNDKANNYRMRAASVLGAKIVAPLIKGKKYRQLLTGVTDELRVSKSFRDRQVYLQVAISTHEVDTEIFKKHFAKNIGNDLEQEKCHCVKIMLAKMCNVVKDGYSKSVDKVRAKLIADDDKTILQYMPSQNEKAKVYEKERRFLALNYGDEQVESTEKKQVSEEEWLQKEQKEIEEVEKTVTIRFANYSTLMRAQTLTQGLSAQLAMFLSTMGGGSSNLSNISSIVNKGSTAQAVKEANKDNMEFNKKLFEKAGIKVDKAEELLGEEDEPLAKKRSLSPTADMLEDQNERLAPVVLSQESNGEIMEDIINIQREEPEQEDSQVRSVPKPTQADSKTEPEAAAANKQSDKPMQQPPRDSTPPPEADKEEWSI